jgi:uridine kinase
MHSKLSIGIAGGTGSGKTTLSKFLASGLSNYKVTVIHMDKYFIVSFSGNKGSP